MLSKLLKYDLKPIYKIALAFGLPIILCALLLNLTSYDYVEVHNDDGHIIGLVPAAPPVVQFLHTLFYDFMNRPYIVYSKIEGYNMADFVFSDLDYEKISLELAKEIYRVHSINSKDIEGVELYTKKELLDMFCSDFDYIPDYSHISEMLNDETLIHGDFHRHNILLNDRKEVVAILDFATFSKGSIYFDIGHMILSVKSPAFSVKFIENYEKISQKKLDKNKLKSVIDFIYTIINENYLPYINAKKD